MAKYIAQVGGIGEISNIKVTPNNNHAQLGFKGDGVLPGSTIQFLVSQDGKTVQEVGKVIRMDSDHSTTAKTSGEFEEIANAINSAIENGGVAGFRLVSGKSEKASIGLRGILGM